MAQRQSPRTARLTGAGLTILLHAAAVAIFLWAPSPRPVPSRVATLPLELLPLTPAPTPSMPPVPVETKPPPDPAPRPKPMRPAKPVPVALPAPAPSPDPPPETMPPPEAVPPSTAITLPTQAPPPPPETSDAPADYVGLLAQRLATVKHYPAEARAARQEGTVQLVFRLDRTGRLLSWHIAHGSGFAALDAEVGEMVEAASPFPPFPAEMKQMAESFLVPIDFGLRQGLR